jgi:hypothetical protein
MTVLLVELPVPAFRAHSEEFEAGARASVEATGGRVVETTFASDLSRLYVIVEGASPDVLSARLARQTGASRTSRRSGSWVRHRTGTPLRRRTSSKGTFRPS